MYQVYVSRALLYNGHLNATTAARLDGVLLHCVCHCLEQYHFMALDVTSAEKVKGTLFRMT